jgi:hypothetical protein
MHHTARLAVCSIVALLAGCDRVQALFSDAETKPATAETKPAETKPAAAPTGAAAAPTEAAAAPTEAAPTPDAAAAPAADQPCIVGRWDAIEYTAAVRHAIAKDPQLRSMKKTSSGGNITYVIDPPTGTSGAMRATAEDLKFGFSGKVEGFSVHLDIDIDGVTEATYELPSEGSIVVSKPKSNTMKVKANVKVAGLGSKKASDKVDLDFDGSFVYECSERELKVWRGARSDDAMVFARNTSG